MAKKRIDLWGDHNSYNKQEVSTSADSSFSLGKEKKSKKGGASIHLPHLPHHEEVDPSKMTYDEQQRKLKNPLSVVEGKAQVQTDVSTAVSAALAKAMQEDYEIEELGKILDVVIDEVDDPDLSNESLRRRNFGILPLFLAIGSVVLAIIIIPLVLLLGYSIGKVSDYDATRNVLGYKTDLEGKDEATHFAIQHIDSGKYLTPPLDETGSIIHNAPLTLTSNTPYESSGSYINDLYFHVPTNAPNEIQISYDAYSIINDNGNVRWMDSLEAQSGIYLVKDTSEQKFSIGFENTNQFLAYNKKSDTLELSNNPDYFKFEAEVTFITDQQSYLSDYTYLYSGTDGYVSNLELGISGNPLSIYSTKTHKNLGAYKYVNYHDLPFIEIENGEYYDSFETTNKYNFDFFINSAGTPVGSQLSIGAYQTTKFDWTHIPWEESGTTISESDYRSLLQLTPSAKTQYPLLTAVGDSVYLEQYTNSYLGGHTMADGTIVPTITTDYPETVIYFLPDPTNLKNKAIYFVNADAFLSTEGGIHLQHINNKSQISDLDFFEFTFSENRNPENIHATVDGLSENSGSFTLDSNNYRNLEGWELFLEGISAESAYEVKEDIAEVWADNSLTPEQQWEEIYTLLKDSKTDDAHFKQATKNNTEAYTLSGLEFDTWYIGYANVYRDSRKNVGEHSTSIPIIFKTADSSGGVSNWGDGSTIDIKDVEAGDPTDSSTSSTPAVITELTETTWLENPDSVNSVPNGESTNDLMGDDMREMASTSLEVTTNLTNGKITNSKSGVVKGIRITLYDSDDDEVEVQEYTTTDVIRGLEDGDYTFLFIDLDPSETYTVTLEVQDVEDEWFIANKPEDDKVDQEPLELTTERLLPPPLNYSIDATYNSRGEGIEVPIEELTNFESNDTINFIFTNKNDGSRIETGFKPLSSYLSSSGVSASGKLTINLKEYTVAGGYGLSIGASSSTIGEEYTFETLLKVGPGDFDDWPDESPLWYDADQGQIKLFDGTVKRA